VSQAARRKSQRNPLCEAPIIETCDIFSFAIHVSRIAFPPSSLFHLGP
jgi:hypothetical protein